MARKKSNKKIARQAKRKINKTKRLAKRKALVKKIKRIGNAVVYAPLLPLKAAMSMALKKKGVSTKGLSFPETIKIFHNKIVQGSSHFESPIGEIPDHFDMESENLIDDALSIVKTVVNFFSGLKAKKASGVPLTSIEENLVKQTNNVTEKLMVKNANDAINTDKEMQGGNTTNPKTIFGLPMVAVIGGAGILAFLLLRKK